MPQDKPRELGDHAFSRRQLLRGSALLGATFALPGLLGACDASSGPAARGAVGPARHGGRLVVAVHDGGAQDVLAPWSIPTYAAAGRAQQVYERLFNFGPDGKPAPRLAVSAESNANGTVWRVKLRPDVSFHNGKKFTAQDVLYSYGYVADTANQAESAPRLEAVDLAASRAVSDLEIEFRLKRSIGDFKGLLAEKALWIVPQGTTNFDTPVGTGPFIFSSWQPGVRALYKRNPHYWGASATTGPFVDELEIQTITDQTARLNALLGGQVQEITFLDFVSAKARANDPSLKIVRTAQPSTTPFYMQIDSSTFMDPRVREAMKLAVDRETLVKNVLLGFGSVGNDLFGKGQPSYNSDIPQRAYDPEKAVGLLRQAGVDRLRLALPTSTTTPGMLESAAGFKQQATRAGIDLELVKLPSESYFSNNQYMKVPFYQTNWGQGFESQAQDGLLSNAPYNETHWSDANWDAEFRKAQGIVDESKRLAAYKALQEPLWERGGYIVWGTFDTLDAVAPHVHGVVPNISSSFQNLGGFEFKDHWLEA